jgi:hypothetical protein
LLYDNTLLPPSPLLNISEDLYIFLVHKIRGKK